jgi:hypothetical protein
MSPVSLTAQLIFLVNFHKKLFLLIKSLKWLQRKDERLGKPGYLIVSMPVHVYVMPKELDELKKNWMTKVKYIGCSLKSLTSYTHQ